MHVFAVGQVYQRRKEKLYGPLTPHEIKDITVKQFKQVKNGEEKKCLSRVVQMILCSKSVTVGG